MIIKNIPTTYNGVVFRSRLEARWAYYFDNIGIKWMYEFEGFDINGEWYLPDFYIPGFGYLEIKPDGGADEKVLLKCKLLCEMLPKDQAVGILEGPPSLKSQRMYFQNEGYIQDMPIVFTQYSARKWGAIPYYCGEGYGSETFFSEDDDEVSLINMANNKRFG